MKLPCKHYKDYDELKNDTSAVPIKKSILNRSGVVSSDTTKDYSSIQRYLNSARSKEPPVSKRRKIDISSNMEVLSNPELEQNQSENDKESIFTQNLVFQNKTPLKQRLNDSLPHEINQPLMQESVISPLSTNTKFNPMLK